MQTFTRNASRLLSTYFLGIVSASLFASIALADGPIVIPTRAQAQKVNENKIGIVFTHEELFHQLVHNMESELEHDSGLRIVPIMGKNHVQSVYDLLFLEGVDLALVRADAIEFVRRMGDYPAIRNLIDNVAKVSEEKLVIIARNEYENLEDLEGQVVGFGLPGSGEYVTSTIAFDTLGIQPDYIEVNNTTAIEKLKSGELAAMVYLLRAADAVQTGGDLKAANAIKNLRLGEALHIMNIPETDELSTIYTPTTLTTTDLPGLIEEGEAIDSYAVDAILAVYRWKEPGFRREQTNRFVEAFVGSLEGLQSDVYQPAWTRVDLNMTTPNVATSSFVSAALEEREEQISNQRGAENITSEQAASQARADKIVELLRKKDELAARIGNEGNQADADEMESMLEELDAFLSQHAK